MIAELYLSRLADDFESQGLGRVGGRTRTLRINWNGLCDILMRTQYIGSANHQAAVRENPNIRTRLGMTVLNYGSLEHPVAFSGGAGYTCCGSAERKLLSNISLRGVNNKTEHSPVIVRQGTKAQAITKGEGERTCYGLVTNLELGLIAGAFSEPPQAILERLRPAEGAFYIDTEELGLCKPLRLGGILTPH